MFTLQLVIALLSQSALIAAAPYNRAIQARDNLDDIVNALAPVSQSLAQVDAAVLALDGGPVTANNLLVSSQQAQAATDQATLNIQASGELGAIRAARLRRTTDALIDQTTTTVNDLVSRKPVLDNLGVSPVALESLQRQKISTMALSAALEEKVPRVGQRIAAEGRSQLESVLDQGIAAYSQPAVAAVPIAAPPVAAPPAAAPPAAAPPAAAPPAAAVPAPAAPAAAVPADPNAGTWPDQAGAAPQAGAPAAAAPAPATGAATPAAPAVPVAVVPSTVNGIAPPPPQITRPAGRRLRGGRKNGNNREVEAVEADEE
ncbi:cell wall protein [Colletotrichum sojae]|uniref:Cell wall protein n=1 Tax=Colletotrichum sojae TaxID=2175907 RepID=A0A8H6J294_9PEZI|nr:cell wall protein [Colletotrichum sojae]